MLLTSLPQNWVKYKYIKFICPQVPKNAQHSERVKYVEFLIRWLNVKFDLTVACWWIKMKNSFSFNDISQRLIFELIIRFFSCQMQWISSKNTFDNIIIIVVSNFNPENNNTTINNNNNNKSSSEHENKDRDDGRDMSAKDRSRCERERERNSSSDHKVSPKRPTSREVPPEREKNWNYPAGLDNIMATGAFWQNYSGKMKLLIV